MATKHDPAAAQYAYEYGKRWNAKTPRRDISYVVGNLHVGLTDEEVTHLIAQRLAKAGPEFTAGIRRQCCDYALLCHHANQKLYRYVMRGL